MEGPGGAGKRRLELDSEWGVGYGRPFEALLLLVYLLTQSVRDYVTCSLR